MKSPFFNWPVSVGLEQPGLQSRGTKAYLLAGRWELDFVQGERDVTLKPPESAPDRIASVVCVEIADQVANVNAQKLSSFTERAPRREHRLRASPTTAG
ncbi:MAG: hypothetical protein RJB26_2211, partial [Pseudomonadota bacterium]